MRATVTALAIAVVGGLVILIIEYSYFNPRTAPERNVAPETPAGSTPSHKLVVEDNNLKVSPAHDSAKSASKPSASARYDDLKALAVVAKKIYGSTARNAEYARIVDAALEDSELILAADVAHRIYGSTVRNAAYEKIIQAALVQRRFEFAETVAAKVYGSDKRNALYKQIIVERRRSQRGAEDK